MKAILCPCCGGEAAETRQGRAYCLAGCGWHNEQAKPAPRPAPPVVLWHGEAERDPTIAAARERAREEHRRQEARRRGERVRRFP